MSEHDNIWSKKINYSWIVDHQNGSIFNLKKKKKSDNDERHYSFRTNNLFLDKLEGKVVEKKTRKDKLYVRIDGEASSVLQVVGLRK